MCIIFRLRLILETHFILSLLHGYLTNINNLEMNFYFVSFVDNNERFLIYLLIYLLDFKFIETLKHIDYQHEVNNIFIVFTINL